MTIRLRLAAAILLLSVPVTARAAGDHELLAAEQELKIAKDHLRDAGTDYEGHRRAAIDYVDKALQEIRKGLDVSRGRGESPPGRQPKREHPPAGGADDD